MLAEGGWPAVTTRALAEQAGANVGLIHYHFGGLSGLHAAIARKVGVEVIVPIVDALLEAQNLDAGLAAVRRLVPATTSEDRTSRLAVELMTGALRNPVLGEVVREALREAQTRIDERLEQLRPSWPEPRRIGTSILIAALLDGFMLHALLDPLISVDEALSALKDLINDRLSDKENP